MLNPDSAVRYSALLFLFGVVVPAMVLGGLFSFMISGGMGDSFAGIGVILIIGLSSVGAVLVSAVVGLGLGAYAGLSGRWVGVLLALGHLLVFGGAVAGVIDFNSASEPEGLDTGLFGAVCAADDDCSPGSVCRDGACAPAPPSGLSSALHLSLPGTERCTVAAADRSALLSCATSAGERLHIIEHTDAGELLHTLDGHALSAPTTAMHLSGTVLYLGGEDGLGIVDLSDPAAPVQITRLDTAETAQSIHSLHTIGDRLIVQGEGGVHEFDLQTPTAPVWVSGLTPAGLMPEGQTEGVLIPGFTEVIGEVLYTATVSPSPTVSEADLVQLVQVTRSPDGLVASHDQMMSWETTPGSTYQLHALSEEALLFGWSLEEYGYYGRLQLGAMEDDILIGSHAAGHAASVLAGRFLWLAGPERLEAWDLEYPSVPQAGHTALAIGEGDALAVGTSAVWAFGHRNGQPGVLVLPN